MFAGVGSSHALTITLLWGCTSNHWARTCETFQRVGGRRRLIVQTKKISGWWQWRSSWISEISKKILFGAHFWIGVWMLFPPLRYQQHAVSKQDIKFETHFLCCPLVRSSFSQDKFSAPFLTNLPIEVLRQCWGKRSKSPPYNFCGRGGMYLKTFQTKHGKTFIFSPFSNRICRISTMLFCKFSFGEYPQRETLLGRSNKIDPESALRKAFVLTAKILWTSLLRNFWLIFAVGKVLALEKNQSTGYEQFPIWR